VTIPENLRLSDLKKCAFNKGLNFVHATKQTDEFSIREGIERFIGCVELQDFLRDHENNYNKLEKDIFEPSNTRQSKRTPTEGQFTS